MTSKHERTHARARQAAAAAASGLEVHVGTLMPCGLDPNILMPLPCPGGDGLSMTATINWVIPQDDVLYK
jgi:hypothetical protein